MTKLKNHNYIVKYKVKKAIPHYTSKSGAEISWCGGTALVEANDKREARNKAKERVAKTRKISMGPKTKIIIVWVKKKSELDENDRFEETHAFELNPKTKDGGKYGV